jgi:phage terminase large subunit
MLVKIPYKPQPYQLEWHNCQTRFLVAVCGRQIGKTTAAVNELIKRSLNNPGSRNWYVTRDYKQAKRNVWDEIKRYILPEMGCSLTETPPVIKFPNGSKIELIGIENAESLRGAVVNFMILDEYADFPREVWSKVLEPMMSTTEGDVWFIGTPKGMGNDFYDRYFAEDDESTKFKLPACVLDGDRVISLTSEYGKIKTIQKALNNSPKDAFDQEYLAEFTRPSGTVYSDWPLENFKEVNYDVNLPIHITMDFGINDPTSLIWLQPNGSEYRVIDYYEASNAELDHFVSVIRSKPYKSPELYTGDVAGNARTLTTGTSPIEILASKGIHVRTKGGVKIPDQIRATHGLIKSLFVSNQLTRFRDCLLNYRYPEVKETARNQENELPIHDEFSHAMRALEYYAVNIKDVGYEEILLPEYKPTFSRTGY